MRITFGDIKDSRLPKVLGLAPCSSEFRELVSEAQQRILTGPEIWWEAYQKYAFTVTNGYITWPRQVASIISVTVDESPVPIRNEWFEYLETGYGMRSSTNHPCNGLDLVDRGTACLFNDIDTSGNAKTLKLYSTLPETAGQYFVVMGYDVDGVWVRTQHGGSWVDGEYITIPTLSTTPRTSNKQWSSITGIIKPETNGDMYLYESDAVGATQRLIGIYESDETRPSYRRTYLSGLPDDMDDCCTVTAQVRRELLPIRNDNDFLIIGNMPALKEMAIAIQKRERGNLNEASAHEAKAFELMDREVGHYVSPGTVAPLRFEGFGWGAGEIAHVQ